MCIRDSRSPGAVSYNLNSLDIPSETKGIKLKLNSEENGEVDVSIFAIQSIIFLRTHQADTVFIISRRWQVLHEKNVHIATTDGNIKMCIRDRQRRAGKSGKEKKHHRETECY